jgi:dihydropyrimidinase
MRLVIRNGQIVTPTGVMLGDVGIDNSHIAAITLPGVLERGHQEIDAEGLHVLPGAIDAHVHPYLDGWDGTLQAAAFGGVTTVLFMAKYKATETVQDLLDEVIVEQAKKAAIDYSIHLVLREPFHPRDMEYAHARGVTSFKVFMNHMNQAEILSDAAIFRAMREARRLGGICLIHAEHGELIDLLKEEKLRAEQVGPDDYLQVHHPLTEVMAVERGLTLAELADCKVYFVHITTEGGLERVRRAGRRDRVFAETCLPFAILTDADLRVNGPIMKITPAPRPQRDVDAVWCGLQDGSLDVVSSDHAPQLANIKRDAPNIFQVPSGLPGTEVLLPLLHSEGVVRRGLPLTWLARMVSENPARIFGLAPRKGAIAIGADADLVLFDPNAEWQIKAADLHSLAGFTPFEGKTIRGRAKTTLVRGTVVMQDGEITAPAGHGQFLARQSSNGYVP